MPCSYFYWKESSVLEHAVRELWRKQEVEQEPGGAMGKRSKKSGSQSQLTSDHRAGQGPHCHPHGQHRRGKDHTTVPEYSCAS